MTSDSAAGDADDIILRHNLRAFVRDSAKTIEDIVADIDLGRFDDAGNVARLTRELNTARLELMKIENRLSQEGHDGQDTSPYADLDFDDIRDQIGRRLDRIRATRHPSEVSKQSDTG